MFRRMLKKDLKRNKTMNIILFLFVIIASMFFASGLYNLISVLNGTDYQFKQAGIGDYQLITMGYDVVGMCDDTLDGLKEIKSYRKDEVVYVSDGDIKNDAGKKLDVTNVGLAESVSGTKIRFFDKDDKEITSVAEGEVYISGKFARDNKIEVGDKIRIDKSDVKLTLTYAGSLKDGFLGSSFMGNPRFYMNDADYKKLYDDEMIRDYYMGEVIYIDTDDVGAVSSGLSSLTNVSYSKPVDTIKTAFVMNLIVAFVVVILSICLMIVSFVVLRFSINFSIGEDFREIGIMKAIGIRDKKIRSLYLTKYAAIAVVGSVIGFFLSIPFGAMILETATRDMILGSKLGNAWNIIGSFAVAAFVNLFAYLSTRKVKKLTPIDAVRSGQTGERFKKKGGIRITKSAFRPSFYMALNDCLSSPKRFLNIIISFSLCTLVVLIIINTASTMNSDSLLYLFGPENDVYITDTEDVMKYTGGSAKKEDMEAHLAEMEKKYTDEGMPCKASIGIIYTYQVEFDGNAYSYSVEQDMNTSSSEFKMEDGSAPMNVNEVAITDAFTKLTGATIGDSIFIDFGEGQQELIVVGRFQSLNNVGQILLIHEDAPTDFEHLSTPMQYRLKFTDSPDQKTIDERIERIKEITGNNEVFNGADYCVDCVKVYDVLNTTARLLLIVVLIVVILVTILMERSFIADEKSEIAIVKAIGFKDSAVIRWHVNRFIISAFIAMLIAVGLSIPITKISMSPIFGLMGASKIDFRYDILRGFIIYPLIILIVTIITAALTALYTKTIESRDTASIE